VVFGGRRHLGLAAGLIRGEAREWPSPFDVGAVVALRGRAVCVLASGDPFLHGVGGTLARAVRAEEMRVVPGVSAFGLAAARMGWALQEVETLALHGRPVALVRPLLQDGVRVLALTGGAEGPGELARLLVADGFGASRVTVLEALGGPRERVVTGTAEGLVGPFGALNVVAVEVAGRWGLPLGAGLPDGAFLSDGQISKREIRAVTLAALAPRRGETLWDVGAGSGSVGIEWMRAHPSLRCVAVEARGDRAARVRANAEALGVPGLRVVEGEAPGALEGLPVPDAVFLGGGAGEAFEAASAALRPGGRLVVNAVTLETQRLVLGWHGRLGGDLAMLSVARAAPVGGMTAWRPAMPVVQWAWVKP
jgi:precorrin-6Y C5,15-methyltransferase (decarboxylating)